MAPNYRRKMVGKFLKYQRVAWDDTWGDGRGEHAYTGIVLQQQRHGDVLVLALTCDSVELVMPLDYLLSPVHIQRTKLRPLHAMKETPDD